MSDTPRTDAAVEYIKEFSASLNRYIGTSIECVSADFARSLEREIAELQTRLAHMSED